MTLSCGVTIPRGSVLGSLLFVRLYQTIIKRHGLEDHRYADDMQPHFSCKLEDVAALVNAIIAWTDELSTGMRSNRLKLNCDKTDRICITTAQQHKMLVASTVTVGSASVHPSAGVRCLAVYFDGQLNLKQKWLQCE